MLSFPFLATYLYLRFSLPPLYFFLFFLSLSLFFIILISRRAKHWTFFFFLFLFLRENTNFPPSLGACKLRLYAKRRGHSSLVHTRTFNRYLLLTTLLLASAYHLSFFFCTCKNFTLNTCVWFINQKFFFFYSLIYHRRA